MRRQLPLNLFIHGRGHHEASWRHSASSPLPLTDIRYTVELARKAEASFFDSIFLADVLGLWNDVESTPFNWLDDVDRGARFPNTIRGSGSRTPSYSEC